MDVHVFFNVVTIGAVTGQLDIRLNDTNVLVSKNVTLSSTSNDTSITVSIPQVSGIALLVSNAALSMPASKVALL